MKGQKFTSYTAGREKGVRDALGRRHSMNASAVMNVCSQVSRSTELNRQLITAENDGRDSRPP